MYSRPVGVLEHTKPYSPAILVNMNQHQPYQHQPHHQPSHLRATVREQPLIIVNASRRRPFRLVNLAAVLQQRASSPMTDKEFQTYLRGDTALIPMSDRSSCL